MKNHLLKRTFAALAFSAFALTSIVSISVSAENHTNYYSDDESSWSDDEVSEEESSYDEPTEAPTEISDEESSYDEPSESPTEAPNYNYQGPHPDGSFGYKINNSIEVISADEIAGSPLKPHLIVSTETVNAGDEVKVTVYVNTGDWDMTGVHVNYDSENLELIKASWSDGVKNSDAIKAKDIMNYEGGVFFITTGNDDYAGTTEYAVLTFKVTDSAKSGDFYPVSIGYVAGDIFTSSIADERTQILATAYTFTRGITNGGVKIKHQIGPTDDGGFIGRQTVNDEYQYLYFTKDEISASPLKPHLTVDTIKGKAGDEVTVTVNVNTGDWNNTGVHVEYDDSNLTLVDVDWSDDVKKLNVLGKKQIAKYDGGVFFYTTSGSGEAGTKEYAVLVFKVNDNAKAGDFYPVNIRYVEGDIFTLSTADESTKHLATAYTFTQGITNGGVEVIETTEPTPSDKPMIIPTNLTMNPGDTSTILTINVPEGKTVSWTSDNTKVATVSNGIVTAIGEGTATIYAICGNSLMSCTVRVTDNSITYGDANGDGKLSISDAVKIMSYASNPAKNPLENANCCDVYNRGDGVDAMDSLSVQKRLINVISVLPESFM